ncbi:MAG: flagellar basal-body rod protein FlgF [Desulfobacterales bacterium]|nr:MAG: flagellar basal-body rod protein FlgF [Desulfobacterales bacterium]
MTGSIYMAANGALAYQKRLQVLSNNLANANTVGFKQDQSHFQTYYLSEFLKRDTPMTTDRGVSQAPSFWFRLNTYTDHTQGPLKETGNRLDLAINGRGFFCVQTPQGIQYTRNGNFTLSADGLLITPQGWPVLGQSGEIVIERQSAFTDPQGHDFLVDQSGNVSVDGNIVDKFRIVDFENSDNLEKVGDSSFIPRSPNMVESPATDFTLSQGVVELSNVNALQMMTELIEVHRGFESYQKVIRSIDEVNSKIINEVGGPQ